MAFLFILLVVDQECQKALFLFTCSIGFHSEEVHHTRSEVECNLWSVITTFDQVGILNQRHTMSVTITGPGHPTTEEHRRVTPFHFCDSFAGEWSQRGDSLGYL